MDPNTEEPLRDPETGLCIECEEKEPGQLIGRISKRSPVRQYDGYVSEQASEKKVLRNVFKPGDAWFASGEYWCTCTTFFGTLLTECLRHI